MGSTMDFEMNLEHQRRQAQIRRLAHKLATTKSKKRVVRRLPQAYAIERPKPDPRKVARHSLLAVRRSLNTYKVAGYAVLTGLAMAAFILDFDTETLGQLRDSIQELSALSTQLLRRT